MKTYRKSRLVQILSATKRNAAKVMRNATEKGKEVMDQLAAVDTGYMKSRNSSDSIAIGDKVVGVIENDTPYGIFVESGTRKMGAQPFFRPAVDVTEREIKAGMRITDK